MHFKIFPFQYYNTLACIVIKGEIFSQSWILCYTFIHVKVNFNGWHETPSSLLMIFKIGIYNKWANWNAHLGPLPSNANEKMAKCDKGQTHTHESFMHDLQLIIQHLLKWFYVGDLVNMWLVTWSLKYGRSKTNCTIWRSLVTWFSNFKKVNFVE
jgi:hypothetical protein